MNKVLLLAGLVTVATVPAAFATEEANCTAVSDRHVGAQARVETVVPVAPPAAASTMPNSTTTTDADGRAHKDTMDAPAVAATAPSSRTHARKHPRTIEAGVPDSVLIGDTGTL